MGSGGHGHKGVKGGVLFAALLLSAFFSSALSHRLHKGDKLGHLVPIGEAASHSSSSSSTTTTTTAATTTASPYVHYPNLDPNNDSKRRVPNGPDPIHNRRAGKSRQPPGRA